MKNQLPWMLAGILAFGSSGCIFVHVKGDLGDELWDDEDGPEFRQLRRALNDCLVDPEYDLDVAANPWHSEFDWTVHYASEGSDGHMAFRKAKEAVLQRIREEGGTLTEEENEGPHAWSCRFRLDDEPGEASVRLTENADEDDQRPHQLEVTWEESD
jgi:hypothetical protein